MAKREFISAPEQLYYSDLCHRYLPILRLNLLALGAAVASFQLLIKDIPLQHPALFLLFSLTPLLLATFAVWRGSYRGAIWTCFISMFYFMAGVLNWTHPKDWAFGTSETLLSVMLFSLSLYYARWKGFSELPVK
ncbi:DUF2069 domain-containing protein [Maribrevibacterium harenarium]|uniref:DUF2069 domain-containing protein n=1 Tax=Maribrevibacterium harenarium TaxID=2589817 RepID=A0A501WUZ5_9GAMM|nr:DUF2069 domain-containing protein [Maribrevibacterium harenarium]TPE51994.1 DUF2069 domain-containing protein [Maribrevibacterium harenarium]